MRLKTCQDLIASLNPKFIGSHKKILKTFSTKLASNMAKGTEAGKFAFSFFLMFQESAHFGTKTHYFLLQETTKIA